MSERCGLLRVRSSRPIGGRREACWAWPGFEPTRRAKLEAWAASGQAGLVAAGDLAGLRRWLEIWRGTVEPRDLAGYGQHRKNKRWHGYGKPATRRPPVICASWGT